MPKPLLCFVHIPKTAGTSIKIALEAMFGAERVGWIGHAGMSPKQWVEATGDEFDGYDVFGGHTQLGMFTRIKRPLVFASLVREPIIRAASLYNYIFQDRWGEKHPFKPYMAGKDIVESYETFEPFREQIEQAQCWYLSDDRTFESARKSLTDNEWIIGTTDNAAHTLWRIARRFGLKPPPLPRENTATIDYASAILTTEARRILSVATDEDRRLLELVQSIEGGKMRRLWRRLAERRQY